MKRTFCYLSILGLAALCPGIASAQLITEAEYYFNTDPGQGQATPVAITPGQTEVDLVIDVPGSAIAALGPGLHRVWSRVRDENGQWSESLARTFRIDGPGLAPEPDPLPVARIDYRWYLNGSPVGPVVSLTPAAPASTIAFDQLAGLAGLQDGLTYQLVATPYDTLGTAGFSVTKSIAIQTVDSDNDGLSDLWETTHGLNPNLFADAALDSDNDGLTNLQEFELGTRPDLRDTAGNGLSDGYVHSLGLDPTILHPGLRAALLAGSGQELGLVSEEQIRALSPDTPILSRNPLTGKFTVEIGLQQSGNLNTWTKLPLSNQQSLFEEGNMKFTFDAPLPTQFYRVTARE